MAALGAFWTIKGDNARVIAVAAAVEDALRGWVPAPDEVDAAVTAAALTAMNTEVGQIMAAPVCLALLDTYGATASTPRVRGMVEVLRVQDTCRPARQRRAARPDRRRGATGRPPPWRGCGPRTTARTPATPRARSRRPSKGLALVGDDDGPWLGALLHTLLAGLNAQLGKHAEAASHALAALPALDELEANDDAIQVRSLLAVNAMTNGELDVAERYLVEIEQAQRAAGRASAARSSPGWPGPSWRLARGEVEPRACGSTALAVEELRELRFPGMGDLNGLEPWALFAESAGATAYAVHGSGDEGADLFEALRGKLPRVLDPDARRTWTTRSPGWCSTASGPGDCSRRRCPSRTPSGCSSWPTCSPTRATP